MIQRLQFRYPKFIKDAFFTKSKFSIISAGRRSGKTYNAAQWLCDELLDPNTQWGFNPQGLWVDTTQGNCDQYVEQYFKHILKDVWALCHYSSERKKLTLPNGIPIKFGSSERPELLEGFEYPRGVLNEGGIILKKAALWDNTLQPMFKGDTTKVRIIGTPKGKNKFHKLSLQYETHHFTCWDSPYWDKNELEKLQLETPQLVWKQEYLAEFIDDGGSVFRNILQNITNREDSEARAGATYIIGIDLAKFQDFTVIMVADVSSKEIVYIERFNEIDWSFQKQKILNVWNKFKRPRIIIDATGAGNPIYDDLHNAGVNIEPFIFTASSKKELIWDLAIALDNKEIKYPNNELLINELESFGYEMTRAGNITYSAPDGMHDDMVIALALVNKLIKLRKGINLSFI